MAEKNGLFRDVFLAKVDVRDIDGGHRRNGRVGSNDVRQALCQINGSRGKPIKPLKLKIAR